MTHETRVVISLVAAFVILAVIGTMSARDSSSSAEKLAAVPVPVEAWGGRGQVVEVIHLAGDSWTGAMPLPFPLARVELKKNVITVTAIDLTGQAKVGDEVRVEQQTLLNQGTYESSFYFIRPTAQAAESQPAQ